MKNNVVAGVRMDWLGRLREAMTKISEVIKELNIKR